MKLAARMQQPVHYQELQHFLPRDAFTPAAETTVPKLLQAQLLPQLARQPATAEKARTSQLEAAHFHGDLVQLNLLDFVPARGTADDSFTETRPHPACEQTWRP